MKLGYITIMIRDMEASVKFYEQVAGLHIIRRFNPGMGEITFMANGEGETMIELIQFDNVPKVETKGMVVSFTAEGKLEDARKLVVGHGYEPTEIQDHAPKPRFFTVPDPDGIVIEITE